MRISLTCLLLFIAVTINAQEILSLESAIDTALKNNFEILIAKNNTQSTKINNTFGAAGGLPSINIIASDNNSEYNLHQKLSTGVNIRRDNVASSSINAGASASMVLFNGFKISATKERLRLLHSQSELQLNQQIQNTIAAIMVCYYDIIRQQNYFRILESSLALSVNKFAIVKARYNVGIASEADVLQAEIDSNLISQNLNGQLIIIEQEKINLMQLMGIKHFNKINIDDTIMLDIRIHIDSILNYLERNPQFLSSEQQIKINEQIVKELRSQRYPSVRINTGYNFIYNKSTAGFNLFNQNYGPTLGATLQIPIFNGTIYKTQQDVAIYNVKNAELEREGLLLSIKAAALKTYQSYKNTLQQLNSQQINYEHASRLVNLIIKRFELNQATILDVKAAQTSFENAGYMLVNLQFAIKIAEIELKRLTYSLAYQ